MDLKFGFCVKCPPQNRLQGSRIQNALYSCVINCYSFFTAFYSCGHSLLQLFIIFIAFVQLFIVLYSLLLLFLYFLKWICYLFIVSDVRRFSCLIEGFFYFRLQILTRHQKLVQQPAWNVLWTAWAPMIFRFLVVICLPVCLAQTEWVQTGFQNLLKSC